MALAGKCYCGQIEWTLIGEVAFTSNCHCKDCQTVSGSAYGTTSLMVYDPYGVQFKGSPKVVHGFSDAGNTTQRYVRSLSKAGDFQAIFSKVILDLTKIGLGFRGFCGNCGTVLFNHVSEGKEDEHWAMRTGCLITEPPKIEKEIYMKSKPSWVPSPETAQRFDAMPH